MNKDELANIEKAFKALETHLNDAFDRIRKLEGKAMGAQWAMASIARTIAREDEL